MWVHLLSLGLIDGAGGNPGVSGSLATTNANDTLSAVGATTITGSLARTNANDTLSAAGSPVISGSLSRTNANDTLAASGAAGAVTGTLAVTNANDTLSATGVTASDQQGSGGGADSNWGGLLHKHKLLQAFKDKQERDAAVKKLPKVSQIERVTLRKSARKLIASEPANYKELESRVAADLSVINRIPVPNHLDWLLYFLRVEAHISEQMRLAQEDEESAIMAILLAITE